MPTCVNDVYKQIYGDAATLGPINDIVKELRAQAAVVCINAKSHKIPCDQLESWLYAAHRMQAAADEIKRLRMLGRWIPVDESLPEHCDPSITGNEGRVCVLLADDPEMPEMAYLDCGAGTHWKCSINGARYEAEGRVVTHWRALPMNDVSWTDEQRRLREL